MSFPDVIVLAGGKGTRLQSVISDVPKPMAPIAGKPFLWYLLNFLKKGGAQRIVLSVGYKKESIIDYFGHEFNKMQLVYAEENEPLGTGGAIAHALSLCESDNVLVYNGDTFFNAPCQDLLHFHIKENNAISIYLKEIENPDRYGTVTLEKNVISAFKEKQEGLKNGLINAGVYCFNKKAIVFPKDKVFSFEKEILETYAKKQALGGLIYNAYFIDIGIPEDYKKANETFEELGY